jgi:hypothetical protein
MSRSLKVFWKKISGGRIARGGGSEMAEVKQLLSLILDTFKSNGGHELVAGSSEVSGARAL